MGVVIRDQLRDDVRAIRALWLAALEDTDLDGQSLHPDAENRLDAWLVDRLRERAAIGLVAEADGRFAGFLLGRVGQWDASPPILRPRPLGLVDVVCVMPGLRKQGIGSQLVSEALVKMARRGAVRVETSYQPGDLPASRMWSGLKFTPSLQRAWRPLGGAGS